MLFRPQRSVRAGALNAFLEELASPAEELGLDVAKRISGVLPRDTPSDVRQRFRGAQLVAGSEKNHFEIIRSRACRGGDEHLKGYVSCAWPVDGNQAKAERCQMKDGVGGIKRGNENLVFNRRAGTVKLWRERTRYFSFDHALTSAEDDARREAASDLRRKLRTDIGQEEQHAPGTFQRRDERRRFV